MEKRTSKNGSAVALFEDVLYYAGTNKLYQKKQGEKDASEVFLAEIPEEVWYMMEAYEGGVFMRGYLSFDIWQYDAVTDTFTCVIKQGEE
ncbi:MAG: hypothetical protein IJD26_09210 [Lachnospiraceae bacterium]|nr:hypothetical protein [Lachnospiraceae bacterium]